MIKIPDNVKGMRFDKIVVDDLETPTGADAVQASQDDVLLPKYNRAARRRGRALYKTQQRKVTKAEIVKVERHLAKAQQELEKQ